MFPTQASFLTGSSGDLPSLAADAQLPQMQWGEVAVEDRSHPEDDPECLPGSYKWLQLTAGAKGAHCWPAEQEPESFRDAACRLPPPPAPAPTQPDLEDGWLRTRNGVLQRQVVLQNLSHATQYNGCVGWTDVSQLESAVNQPPRLLVVQLTAPERQVQVSSAHVFAVGPVCRPRKTQTSLFTVGIKLHTPRGPVSVNALVDTGCELQGIVNKRFAATWDLPLAPASQSVRTATGEVVTGLQQAAVQTHFAPDFTRRVQYGVLDIPGFDVVLGMGFLTQCAPYQLQEDARGRRSVRLTSPSSHRLVQLEAQPLLPITVPTSPQLAATVQLEVEHPVNTAGQLEMQWSVPSEEDYANTVAAFSVVLDAPSAQPVVLWSNPGPEPHEPWLDSRWSSTLEAEEIEEGFVFRLGADAAAHLHHVPTEVRSRFEAILQQYRDSVFPDRDFPPFPPERDVTFRIQLQDGAQIPASPVHTLSPLTPQR